MKVETKHTYGPWAVLPSESDKNYLRVRGTNLGHRYKIANVLDQKYEPGLFPLAEEESFANAALIAASPDLLHALQHAEAVIEGVMRLYPQLRLHEEYKVITDAIEKATRLTTRE